MSKHRSAKYKPVPSVDMTGTSSPSSSLFSYRPLFGTNGYQKPFILVICFVTLTLLYFLFGGLNGILNSLLPGPNYYLTGVSNVVTRPEYKRGFKNRLGVDLYHLPLWNPADMLLFFRRAGNRYCYTNGSLMDPLTKKGNCVCKSSYHGSDCGIPQVIWESEYLLAGKPTSSNVIVKRLHRPRRLVISVMLFNCAKLVNGCSSPPTDQCTVFVDRMLRSLSTYVDLFLIVEITDPLRRRSFFSAQKSNSSHSNASESSGGAHRSRRSARFHSRLDFEIRNGSLNSYANLILHKVVPVKNGSRFDESESVQLESFFNLWHLLTTNVADFRPNDLLMFMAPFEYPLSQVAAFLKFYEGFPEPISFKPDLNQTVGLSMNLTDFNSSLWSRSNHRRANNSHSTSLVSSSHFSRLQRNYQNINYGRKNIQVCHLNASHGHGFYKTSVAVTFEYISALCVFDFDSFVSKMCLEDLGLVKRFTKNFWPVRRWTISGGSRREDCFFCVS